jgi:RNA polymerase sigma-70 factor (ECF subfamily)
MARDGVWAAMRRSAGGEDAADEPALDDALASRQRMELLVAAVAQLPPQMQRAFRLHKLEGHSHAETAKQMGISVSAVEKHISAALRSLLTKLEE